MFLNRLLILLYIKVEGPIYEELFKKNKLLKTNKETLVQMPLFCAIFYETNYNFSTNIEILKSHSLQR
jgi:hypothetical protein